MTQTYKRYNPEQCLPRHIAIIMDGNGRWAKLRNKPRGFGHNEGVNAVKRSIEFAAQQGLEYLSLYSFSQENWQRPAFELKILLRLFLTVLKKYTNLLMDNNIKLVVIGDLTVFNKKIQTGVADLVELTAKNTGLQLNIAVNYSGKWDILQASQKAISERMQNNATDINKDLSKPLTTEEYEQYLSTKGMPDIDLMIRTGGEQRISNFFLWQAAYAELIFLPEFWPEFNAEIFSHALALYQERERRFGNIKES